MKRLLSCEFNFDTVCVELKFSDGTMIAIDTIAVENEVADNIWQAKNTTSYTEDSVKRMSGRGMADRKSPTPSTTKSYYVEGGFSHLIHMTAAHLW